MRIQSLSIVVPNKKCINNCLFCVSKMKEQEYINQLNNNPFYRLYQEDYIDRMEFARDNGCNTVMLTGDSEPQQNMKFLTDFGTWNQMLSKPFRWIEMQTTGTLLDEKYLRFLRDHVRVKTISLSLSSFDNVANMMICQMKKKVDIKKLCSLIKKYDFNLRLSLNMNLQFDIDNQDKIKDLFLYCKSLGADQVTIRELYTSFPTEDINEDNIDTISSQDRWIYKFGTPKTDMKNLKTYVTTNGLPMEKLEFGAIKYSLHGMSIVVDSDCMSKETKETLKYAILRDDCHLYSKWDDKASLIF